MNKKDTMRKRKKVSNRYHKPQSTQSRKWNAIHFSPSNSLQHELKKAHVCYKLQAKGHKFITEAVHETSEKRRDIVDLDTGKIYEVETTDERAKRHEEEHVYVVKIDKGEFNPEDVESS